MALPSDVKQGQCVEWYTELPFFNRPRESPVFIFQNTECYFEFVAHFSNYNISIKSKKDPMHFGIIDTKVYVMYGDNTIICFRNESASLSTPCIVMSCFGNHLREKVQVSLNGTFIKFLFIYTPQAIRDVPLQNVKPDTVEKSVQTPQYLDARFSTQSLSQDLEKFMDTDSEHDAQFICGNSTFKAHKSVLGTRSTVLKTMLQSDMVEGKTGTVQIEEVESTIFEQFLRYVYTGSLPELTVETAKQLYEVGDKYSVEALKKDCASYLLDNLTTDNACEILALADQHSDPDFKENVLTYILDEKLPTTWDNWKEFCGSYPALAIEVFSRFCQMK